MHVAWAKLIKMLLNVISLIEAISCNGGNIKAVPYSLIADGKGVMVAI